MVTQHTPYNFRDHNALSGKCQGEKMSWAVPWLLMLHFGGFGPTLNAIIYISVIQCFHIIPWNLGNPGSQQGQCYQKQYHTTPDFAYNSITQTNPGSIDIFHQSISTFKLKINQML